MSTILTTPTTPSLDHFRNPWIAPAWVFLVALAVAVITVLTAWGLRLVRNRVPAIPPPPEGATPEVIEANRRAHTVHPLRSIGRGLRRIRRAARRASRLGGAVTRWAQSRLQRCESRFSNS